MGETMGAIARSATTAAIKVLYRVGGGGKDE